MSEVVIRLENVGVFRGVREFKLCKGLNIIHAPNASGKSSLVAGLKVVSAPTLSEQEIARVLNDYEDKGSVSILINKNEYLVELTRSSPTGAKAVGKGIIGDGITKIISFLDLENPLVSAVYSGDQEKFKQILRDVSGVSHLETIVSVLNGLKAEYEHQYEIKSKEYSARKSEVEEELSRIEAELRKIDIRINEILKDTRIEPARREIERIEKEMKDLEAIKSVKRAQEIDLLNKRASIEIEEKKKIAELEVLNEKRTKLLEERDQLKTKVIEFRKKIEEIESRIESLKSKKEERLREWKELNSALERREKVSPYDYCPYCSAKIDKEKLHGEINSIRTRLSELRDEIASIDTEITSLESEKNTLKKQGEERLHIIDTELQELDLKISELQNTIKSYREEKSKLDKKLEAIKAEITTIEDKESILKKQLESFKEIPLVNELKGLYEERSRLSEARDRQYGRLKQLEQLYSDVLRLGEIISKINLLIEYFHIRLVELGRIVVEKINEAVSKHFDLLRLAELEYPLFTEGFELRLTRKGGVVTTLAELSDAEKAILTILLTLSLKEYVAEDFPFYVVDGLIEFIDDARAKEVLRYLMEFANRSNIIIVVTKTKPYSGEPRLLTQEDILLNQLVI